jgi:hypothetical protein
VTPPRAPIGGMAGLLSVLLDAFGAASGVARAAE